MFKTELSVGLKAIFKIILTVAVVCVCVPGDECLRVDCVVGQGAFATVYQATNLSTSHKFILKVNNLTLHVL